MSSLSREQASAVEYLDGPALICSGAGAGKTSTIVAKFEYLLEKGCDPGRILCITFTNKAANELKDRLKQSSGRKAADFPWVRTFHSSMLQILKAHAAVMGFTTPISIYDGSDQLGLVKNILENGFNIDGKYAKAVRGHIGKAKNSIAPDAYIHSVKEFRKLDFIFEQYNRRLKESNAMDFDDILVHAHDLLKANPEIRTAYQNLFQYILLDEHQDSNSIQNAIVKFLVNKGNITVVGDFSQSIYGFRGADPGYFARFPAEYEGTKIFLLEQNFRSTAPIVDLGNEIISFNNEEIKKKCFSTRPGNPPSLKGFENSSEEARWVGKRCRAYRRDGLPFEQMAVLYRTSFISRIIENEFNKLGVPYKLVGGVSFFERREIKDLTSYLACAVNPRDDVAFERILNAPKRGIGKVSIQKIRDTDMPGASLMEKSPIAIQKKTGLQKAAGGIGMVLFIVDRIKNMPPGEALREVIEITQYEKYLESWAGVGDDSSLSSRLENIEELLSIAEGKQTIEEFLEDCSLRSEEEADEEEEDRGVRLSTIHAAKGLEYHTVFVVGCERNILPHWRSVEEDDGKSNGGIEEERRLFYVACTRAGRNLHISYADWRQNKPSGISPFLEELSDEHLNRLD
ncbi:MAG: ATP-dependent helicase [Syntrophobacteraceae bacterium]|nr:ATP-dependent helicase [Syntrophobacteraceae bacterium]